MPQADGSGVESRTDDAADPASRKPKMGERSVEDADGKVKG